MQINSQKDINTDRIRTYMRQVERASKGEISRETHLSFPTVTRLLNSLCEEEEIIDIGQGDSTGGRCASIYVLNLKYYLCLLIRLEENSAYWTVKDLKGGKVESDLIHFKQGVLGHLDSLILGLLLRYPCIKAIVIGIDAMVEHGLVQQSDTWEELKGINLEFHFQNLTTISVSVENDMNLVMVGQWYRSRIKAVASVSLYLGERCMGAGMLLNGEVWRGATEFAGELGYLSDGETNEACRINGFKQMDAAKYYADIIRVYAVIFNPSQIILYHNIYIADKLENIRKMCLECLPVHAVPNIELSCDFRLDYEYGLFAAAQKMMF